MDSENSCYLIDDSEKLPMTPVLAGGEYMTHFSGHDAWTTGCEKPGEWVISGARVIEA
jgi:hypothetical protein